MSDLISRNAVIDIIHKEIERTTSFAEHQTQINIEMAVKELPIAYDKEAVVEQLENELKLAEKQKEECTFKALPYYDRTEGYIVAMSNAIEIVKSSGID